MKCKGFNDVLFIKSESSEEVMEITKKFLQLWRSVFNKILYEQEEPQRLEVITEAEEKPSPKPRLSLNDTFLDELDELLEKHNGNSALMVGVTDTNSMEPLIDIGCQIALIPLTDAQKQDIIAGDIVWFKRMSDGAENVLHRVIEVNDGWVVTRGDNLVVSDGPIPFKDIKGYCAMIIY